MQGVTSFPNEKFINDFLKTSLKSIGQSLLNFWQVDRIPD